MSAPSAASNGTPASSPCAVSKTTKPTVSVDRARDGGAYVDNLHVRTEAQGHGVGRRLMAAAARDVLDHGGETLWLTVIRENTQTRAFYRRIGGEEVAELEERLYGEAVATLKVRWVDLGALAALA